jgi:hypothetical protein
MLQPGDWLREGKIGEIINEKLREACSPNYDIVNKIQLYEALRIQMIAIYLPQCWEKSLTTGKIIFCTLKSISEKSIYNR